MSETKDMVSFANIQRSYPPGEEMIVQYVIESGADLKTTKRDWVGLFRVGWTSSRDYYTFEWAPEPNPETNEGLVKFAGRRLPPEDGHFYQLCFVSRDGSVRGASAPFQFSPLSVSLDDMELVEITDDSMQSMMVLQKKSKEEMESLRRESEETRTALTELQRQLNAALTASQNTKTENEALQQDLITMKSEIEVGVEERSKLKAFLEEEKEKSAAKDGLLVDMQQELKLKSEQLSHEQDYNKELLIVKENEDQELKILKNRVSSLEGDIVVLTSDCEDMKQQMRIKESQIDDLQRLVGIRGEELEQMGEKLVETESENSKLHATCAELRANLQHCQEEMTQCQGSLQVDISAALSKKDQHIEKLEQDLACMQANIAELMGATQQSNTSQVTEQPQHNPPLPENVVDKGAYNALQNAYDNFKKYYAEEKAARERIMIQLKNSQEECSRLQSSHQEMVQRVVECKKQYEMKAHECIELQRRLKKGLPTGTKSPKIGQMEQENAEMIRNCQTAAQQLSLRMKENDEMTQKISLLEAELSQAQQKYLQLEDRFDRKTAEKNEELQRQKHVFAEKANELADVMSERDELMAKVTHLTESIKKPRDVAARACPMCNTKFPSRMTDHEFTKHVHGHFKDETV